MYLLMRSRNLFLRQPPLIPLASAKGGMFFAAGSVEQLVVQRFAGGAGDASAGVKEWPRRAGVEKNEKWLGIWGRMLGYHH